MKRVTGAAMFVVVILFTGCVEVEVAPGQDVQEAVTVSYLEAWHVAMDEMGLVPLIDLGIGTELKKAKFIVYMHGDDDQRPLVCELERYTRRGRIWVRSLVSLFPWRDDEGGR